MDHYYWDSCVFLAYISNEPQRAGLIEAMLENCEKGEIALSTSVLTIAEVAFASYEKDSKATDPAVELKIENLWTPATRINLVEVYPAITRDARALMRNGLHLGLMPKPPDAIHLATAKKIGAKEVHTYDKLAKYAALAGIVIKEPNLHQMPLIIPIKEAMQSEQATKKEQTRSGSESA